MAIDIERAFEIPENGLLYYDPVSKDRLLWIGGGLGAPLHDCPNGSTYFQTDTNQRWVKIAPGTGNDKWADAQVTSPTGTITAGFGSGGNNSNNTWLKRTGNVSSNKSGVPVDLYNAELVSVDACGEDLDTYDINIYSHEGDEVNLTLLHTLEVIASRQASDLGLTIAVPTGKQLAARIVGGSARNVGVTCLIKGTFDP